MRVIAMNIRLVQPGDRDEWFRMRDCLWRGSPDDHVREIDAFFVIPQDGATFVVERPNGGLCGFIEISLRNYAEGCITSPVPYIEGWYVDEDIRRQKLGSCLVQAAEEWARNRGFSEMASDTQLDNEVSQQAHQALGYREIDRIVCYRKRLADKG
jgi:aminoglycoside 6'-N-acetyltransferase I